jgi:uncharacterized RDD family membrane protein YckC
MTNTGGTPAGWYYAPGDPEGTQRYWDGAQWIGDPQVVPQQPAPAATPDPAPVSPPTGEYQAPAPDSGAGAPPNFGAPGAPPPGYQQAGPAYGAAPQGYQNYGAPATNVGTPAEWGTRAVAWLIDWGIGVGISIAGLILFAIGAAIADVLGILMLLVWIGASIAYGIWNFCVRQGSTGQTIGKEKQGIKLVKDDTGQPVGAGMAFVRYLLAAVLGGLCGIYTLLDYLWPLWDVEKKRLTDKMVTMSVVVA